MHPLHTKGPFARPDCSETAKISCPYWDYMYVPYSILLINSALSLLPAASPLSKFHLCIVISTLSHVVVYRPISYTTNSFSALLQDTSWSNTSNMFL